MENTIKDFFKLVGKKKVEIYNEFSLQHELGVFLRGQYPELKIQFERNVNYFNFDKNNYEKKEIDLTMFSSKSNLQCAIELKYPRNGQVPESMFSFCKDIKFLEQLSSSGFKKAYFIAVADDALFYSGASGGIYGLFRNRQEIKGIIRKPTGKKDKEISLTGTYEAIWKQVFGTTKYCLIKVQI